MLRAITHARGPARVRIGETCYIPTFNAVVSTIRAMLCIGSHKLQYLQNGGVYFIFIFLIEVHKIRFLVVYVALLHLQHSVFCGASKSRNFTLVRGN